MATVQYFDGSNWADLTTDSGATANAWEITRGVSTVQIAPQATIQTPADSIQTNTDVRIRDKPNSETLFRGYARSGGRIAADGTRTITCDGYGTKALAEDYTINIDSDDEGVVSQVVEGANAEDLTLFWNPTAQNVNGSFSRETTTRKRICRDIMNLRGYVWRIVWNDSADRGDFIVETKGGRGSAGSLTIGEDAATISQYESGSVETVVNKAIVRGKGSQASIEATATDQTSIDTYGEQPLIFKSSWVADQTDAQDLADQLLTPDPLPQATIQLDPGELGVGYGSLVNYTVDVTDPNRGLSNATLRIEQQTVTEGGHELKVGAGAGIDIERQNQKASSSDDAEVIDLDDVADSDNFGRVFADALDGGYHTLEAAVGDLDNIEDGGTYARVREGNVDDDNFVLLATSVGTLDDVDDGSTYGRVLTTGLDAGEIVLAEAVGDLDDIEDGNSFGRVAITNLTPGGAVFATGVELDDGRDLDSITTEDAAKADATVIDGGEILTDSITAGEVAADSITANEIDAATITADEIDVLDLDLDDLSITDVSGNGFEYSSIQIGVQTLAVMEPTTDFVQIGSSAAPFFNIHTDNINTGGVTSTGDISLDEALAVGSNAAASNVGGGEVEIAPDASSYSITVEGLTPGPTILPSQNAVGSLGSGDGSTADKAWSEIHTNNLYEYSPAPIASDASPGPNRVDPEELKASSWEDPPDYVSQRKVVSERDEDGEPVAFEHEPAPEGTVEMGALANYLLETCKAQEERIDDLEERLSALEEQV